MIDIAFKIIPCVCLYVVLALILYQISPEAAKFVVGATCVVLMVFIACCIIVKILNMLN